MVCLSWQRGSTTGFTVAANPIYPLTDLPASPQGSIAYEILEADAELLTAHVGTSHRFIIGSQIGPFLAKIGPLVPVTSQSAGLAMLRNHPTLRGTLAIIDLEGGCMTNQLPVVAYSPARLLTAEEFQRLASVPPETEWFANISNPSTRRAYRQAVGDFMRFTGIARPEEFRIVTRGHVIAWRTDLESRINPETHRPLTGTTIRHRLASLSSLFEYLCDRNAVTHNPVKGITRPKVKSIGGEGVTPALGDHQARALLAAPQGDELVGRRDRAILSTLLFHALRREELCKLRVKDALHQRRGVPHLRVHGKGDKIRYVPLHPGTAALIHDYLESSGHAGDGDGALFRPLRNNRTGKPDAAITPDGIYKLVRAYSTACGFPIGAHALRATAATNALDNAADIAKVQEWLGHANIATTRIYDHRRSRPEDSPTFKVAY